jgi:CheY-like chemotaxis protein
MTQHSPLVLIADDEVEFRSAFVKKHGGSGIAIEQLDDVCALHEHLAHCKQLPDLVVIDLYRTKADPNTPEAEAANAEISVLLSKVESATSELRTAVNQLKFPAAIRTLREIRAIPRLQELPILIYTRQGLSLLSDDDLREAIHLDAEWMLKGRSAALEREQMTSFLRHSRDRQRRLKRDTALTLIGTALGFALSVAWQLVSG